MAVMSWAIAAAPTMVKSLDGRLGRSTRPAVAFEATGSHVRYALEQFLQDPAVPIRISERRGGYRAQSAAARGLPTRGATCRRLISLRAPAPDRRDGTVWPGRF